MVCQLFGKRERLSDEPTTALAQGIFETLDVIGLAAPLAYRTMALGRQEAV